MVYYTTTLNLSGKMVELYEQLIKEKEAMIEELKKW